MNSNVSSVVRFIAQNVTEHLQEDEVQYFHATFVLITVIVCLTISYVSLCSY